MTDPSEKANLINPDETWRCKIYPHRVVYGCGRKGLFMRESVSQCDQVTNEMKFAPKNRNLLPEVKRLEDTKVPLNVFYITKIHRRPPMSVVQ